MTTSIKKTTFGTAPVPVERYTLSNSKGMEVTITNYGGIITSINVPDKAGVTGDVTLGFGDVESYVKGSPYFGAFIGRFGNRIAKGKFTLEGREYSLARNNGPNTLHGGNYGFDKRVWTVKQITRDGAAALEFSYVSPDGEEGFPGTLTCRIICSLTDNNELTFDYSAACDKTTVLSLTQHSYFNLAGEGSGDILGTLVTINADAFTPVDETLIPTGELKDVTGTPFDFRKETAIGARIGENDQQLAYGNGYDHNWVLNKKGNSGLSLAATAYDPKSGRMLEVLTTEPGMQFYVGNFLDGTLIGKSGKPYTRRSGFCMETQHYPDSPNQKNFPSVELKAGEVFTSSTVYRFSTK